MKTRRQLLPWICLYQSERNCTTVLRSPDMDPAMGRWKMKSGVFFLRPTVLVGKLIGGSQREEDYEVLRSRMLDLGLPLEPYEWYLDLRRHGTVKHCGFGLGFE